MKKHFKYLIIAGILSLLLSFQQGCKKEDAQCLNCDKCENFPEPKGFGIGTITQKPFQRKAPCFNPNNGSEFIYVKEKGNRHTLIKYNLDTKQEITLLENAQIVGQPKWGKNGWIVFTRTDLQIYLMKNNGDSLRQVTSFYENIYPSFHGHNKIYFTVGTETSPGVTGNKLIDYFDNRLDSIKASEIGGTMGINEINNLEEIVSWFCKNGGNCSIVYYKMEDKNIIKIYDFEFTGRNNIEGICWHPNRNDFYYSTYREGLYVINKNTKERKKIRNGCDSRSYRFLSISPDGKKILVERVDATDYKNNNGNWTEEAKIYIMDIDGKNERDVFK